MTTSSAVRSRRPLPLLAAVVLGSVAATSLAGTEGRFELIGSASANATAVSDNGAVVAGYDASTFWYWTLDGGLVAVDGVTPFEGGGGVAGLSSDGMKLGLSVETPRGRIEGAIHDIETGSTTTVGNFGSGCGSSATDCWGLSGSGSTLVGLGWHGCAARAFRFTEGGGLVDLGTMFTGTSSRANACSDDGSLVVGWQDLPSGFRQGAYWRDGIEKLVSTSTGQAVGEAGACSADGVWIVGFGEATNSFRAWRFSVDTGYLALPESPIAGFRGWPTAVSDDGSRVLLFYRTAFPPATAGEGYLWDDGTLLSLDDMAAEAGIAVPSGVRMALPLAMSGDGYTIVGVARTATGPRAFVLDLPRPTQCPADLNGDGIVDAVDLGTLLGSWGSSGTADLDGDGNVNAADLAIMLGDWGPCG